MASNIHVIVLVLRAWTIHTFAQVRMAPVTSESAMVVTVVAGWGADDDDGETTCVTDGISEEKGCVYVRRASYEAAGPVRVRSASSSEVRNRKRMSRASYCASDGWVRRSSWSIAKRKRTRRTIEGAVGSITQIALITH